MRRRDFIKFIGGATTAWPVAVQAQQLKWPVIGVIRTTNAADGPTLLVPFSQGLRETGFVDGQNVTIDFHAEEQYDRLPALAAELVRKNVNVIVATGAINAAYAAKAATTTIPVIFIIASDPVEMGLVASLNRPGGNVTGVTLFGSELNAKRIELLREITPNATAFGLLVNPDNPNAAVETKALDQVAFSGGWTLHVVKAHSDTELNEALASLARFGVGGFVQSVDLYLQTRYRRIVELASQYGLPTVLGRREGATAGALISYGSRPNDIYVTAGVYAGRILKGAKPADLPVQLPTTFEMVINLKTAKAMGIVLPTSILLRADEVIE